MVPYLIWIAGISIKLWYLTQIKFQDIIRCSLQFELMHMEEQLMHLDYDIEVFRYIFFLF